MKKNEIKANNTCVLNFDKVLVIDINFALEQCEVCEMGENESDDFIKKIKAKLSDEEFKSLDVYGIIAKNHIRCELKFYFGNASKIIFDYRIPLKDSNDCYLNSYEHDENLPKKILNNLLENKAEYLDHVLLSKMREKALNIFCAQSLWDHIEGDINEVIAIKG